MATNTWVPLRIPEAANLADLTGIRMDLMKAKEFAERLQKVFVENTSYDLVEVLSIACLVAYARPFKSGVRRRLQEEVHEALTEEQRTYHAYFLDIRDKHIAHSVNAFEENQPTARYWVERVKDEGITSIGCQHYRVTGLSANDTQAMIHLTSSLGAHVECLVEAEQKQLLELVRQLPLETVLSEEYRPAAPATPATARSRRKTLRDD